MMQSRAYLPYKIAGIYAFISLAYIVGSDWIVEAGMSAHWRPTIQTLKGIAFVLVSALIIALLIRRELIRYAKVEQAFVKAQRMDAVGQMTSGIAHDFNNLLMVILGNLELIEEETKHNKKAAQYVANALMATDRGAELSRRLLTFSRRQIMEPKLVDVNEHIQSMAKLLHSVLGESIKVGEMLASGLPLIKVDPGQLESAILNLAINARDAMPRGGTISLSTSYVDLDEAYADGRWHVPAGRYVMIAVSDDGEGIPAAFQSRLCEPFFTTKPEGKGTGLGLAMVYGFVKQAGGHIIIYSTPGHGTTVKLYFPAVTGTIHSPGVTASSRAAPMGGHEKILLVENDAGVRTVMETYLRKLGYDVSATDRVSGALSILSGEPGIRLIITDIILGGRRTGIELAREALKINPDVAVLLVSGYADPTLTEQMADLARAGWLAKPFGQNTLAQRVRELLNQ